MQIDIATTPFSVYGSYLALRLADDGRSLILRNVHDTFGDQGRFFLITFYHQSRQVDCTYTATPWELTASASAGTARIVLHGDWGLVVESDGLDVFLQSMIGLYGFGYRESATRFRFQMAVRRDIATVDVLYGVPTETIRWEVVDGRLVCTSAGVDIACESGTTRALVAFAMHSIPTPVPAVDTRQDVQAAQDHWTAYLSRLPEVPEEKREYAELAWYTLWSSTVRAQGCLAYDAVLMSKNWMCNVWSWDHCFNALALAKHAPRAGLAQWLLPFEQQLPTGALPDCINDSVVVSTFVKPPIHGWALQRLLDTHIPEQPVLARVYERLAAWTEWWFTCRDFDADGVPNYTHSNDSGADNASLFDIGTPLEAPDLSAYLVLQLDALARVASLLGDESAAGSWARRSSALLTRLSEHLWEDGNFVGKISGTHTYEAHPTSILSILPLVLGERLDQNIFRALTERLFHEFLTPFGPSSETLTSPKFTETGGYGMRGPIWAPYVYLLADGLRRGGNGGLARQLAERFCRTVERSGSMWEDYDALTGVGRDDPAYTWTASVYLLLLNEYLV